MAHFIFVWNKHGNNTISISQALQHKNFEITTNLITYLDVKLYLMFVKKYGIFKIQGTKLINVAAPHCLQIYDIAGTRLLDHRPN